MKATKRSTGSDNLGLMYKSGRRVDWMLRVLSIMLALTLANCSSSGTDEDSFDESEEDIASVEDAGTDEVPVETAESDPVASSELADISSPPASDAQASPPANDWSSGTSSDSLPPPASELSSNDSNVPAFDTSSPSTQAAAGPTFTSGPYSGATTDYTIQSGDTLMKIAFQTTGDLYRWKEIYELNKGAIPDPNHLSGGSVIKVPSDINPSIDRNGDQYLIKRGDTLGTIAKEVYGDTKKWRKIWKNNSQLIKDPNKIYAGFTLYYVPGSGSHTPELAQPSNDYGAPDVNPQTGTDGQESAGAEPEAAPLSQSPSDTGRTPASVPSVTP